VASFANQKKPLQATFGKGRAVYLPLIRKSRQPVQSYEEIGGYDGFQHLQLPKSWRQLATAVENAAGAPLALKVSAPVNVMAEVFRGSGSDRLLVHLVNYGAKKAAPGTGVVVAGGAGRKARLYMPGEGMDGKALNPVKGKGGCTAFKLPGFARYALVVVEK
jgi:hypothetical protein